jgi:5-formyltetrahydrofolate cyclo-ligase
MSERFTGERKQLLRAAAITQRKSLTSNDRRAWSALIQGKVLQFPLYVRSGSVALYSPIQNEVDTTTIRDHALGSSKIVYYPRIRENCIELLPVDSEESLKIGHLGVLEPIGERCVSTTEPTELTIMVPGVVFDCQGNRLGRGAGWYDRLLKEMAGNATSVGLAYDFQIVGEVPADSWDQRVDYVITERRIVDCAAARAQPSLAS